MNSSGNVKPVALLALLLVAAGCTAAPAPRLPEGITVSVGQNRTDYADRRLQITVQNGTDADLEVRDARFRSAQYTSDAVWAKDGTTVRAGATAALPVLLAGPVCDVDEAEPSVRITLRPAAEDAATVTTVPDDPLDRLPALHSEDCLRQTAESIAGVTASTPPRPALPGGMRAVQLDLSIDPTGADGAFVVDSAIGTTLFALADAQTGAIVPELLIDRTVLGDGPSAVLTLTLVPNRCDLHAIAEDKRGTIFPLRITADVSGTTSTGILSIEATDAVKRELLDYLADACG